MGWLTKSYLQWLKKHKKGDCKKHFDQYVKIVFSDMILTDILKIAFYEIHLTSKQLGKLMR